MKGGLRVSGVQGFLVLLFLSRKPGPLDPDLYYDHILTVIFFTTWRTQRGRAATK